MGTYYCYRVSGDERFGYHIETISGGGTPKGIYIYPHTPEGKKQAEMQCNILNACLKKDASGVSGGGFSSPSHGTTKSSGSIFGLIIIVLVIGYFAFKWIKETAAPFVTNVFYNVKAWIFLLPSRWQFWVTVGVVFAVIILIIILKIRKAIDRKQENTPFDFDEIQ